jgi:hypothetical protein
MRKFFLILAASGCAYQDDDGWGAVDKACVDSPWTPDGWGDETLPEPLASDDACQAVLAEHTGADALGEPAFAIRSQIVWSAWTLALAPMKGPVHAQEGSEPARVWSERGQAGIYEAVVQRLAEAEASTDEVHEIHDGLWSAPEELDTHVDMLPVMVHASQHHRRPGHDPCPDGSDETSSGRPCDTSFDSPAGWEAAVTGLLALGIEDEDHGLAVELAMHADAAADAIQETSNLGLGDEDDEDGPPPEGIE